MSVPYHRFLLSSRALGYSWDIVWDFVKALGFPTEDEERGAAEGRIGEALGEKPEFFAPELRDADSLAWAAEYGIAETWAAPEDYDTALEGIPFEPYRLMLEAMLLAGLTPEDIVEVLEEHLPRAPSVAAVRIYERYVFSRGAYGPSEWATFLRAYQPDAAGDLIMAYSAGPRYMYHRLGVTSPISGRGSAREVVHEMTAMMHACRGLGKFSASIDAAKTLINALRFHEEVAGSEVDEMLQRLNVRRAPPTIVEGTILNGVVIPLVALPQLPTEEQETTSDA